MTPPIGARTDTNTSPEGILLPEAVGLKSTEAPKISTSADYAYRIATLTAGLALIATFL